MIKSSIATTPSFRDRKNRYPKRNHKLKNMSSRCRRGWQPLSQSRIGNSKSQNRNTLHLSQNGYRSMLVCRYLYLNLRSSLRSSPRAPGTLRAFEAASPRKHRYLPHRSRWALEMAARARSEPQERLIWLLEAARSRTAPTGKDTIKTNKNSKMDFGNSRYRKNDSR